MDIIKKYLKYQNILGLNRRNQTYVRPHNLSRGKRIADSKLLSKKILSRNDIPTSQLYKAIYNREHLQMIDWETLPNSMVIKPNEGTGGSGILVFLGKRKGKTEWILANDKLMTVEQIKSHIVDILDGRYSMGGKKDIALIEERIVNHPTLKQYSYKGIPDIRVIVFNKIPVMAMTRLPTRQSDGKGNVHAGAIAVGIDIATGITTTAIVNKGFSFISLFDDYAQEYIERMIDEPYLPLSGIQIPFWKKILEIAIKTQIVSGLGYTGVDIALDKFKGPVVFELNARPGLAIQLANRSGLAERLKRIEGLKVKTIAQGIEIAQTLFGGEVEESIENISGKQIISPTPVIKLYGLPSTAKTKKRKRETTFIPRETVKCRVDTGEFYSYLDVKVAESLKFDEIVSSFRNPTYESNQAANDAGKQFMKLSENHPELIGFEVLSTKEGYIVTPILKIRTIIEDTEKYVEYKLRNRAKILYSAILGRRDLGDFLIDPSKRISG